MILFCPNPKCKEILMKDPPMACYDSNRPASTVRCSSCGEDAQITVEYVVKRKGTIMNPVVKSGK